MKGVTLDGKSFIAKAQEEWKRATCLSIDFFDDEAAVLSWFSVRQKQFLDFSIKKFKGLASDPQYDTSNGAFIEDSANPENMSRLRALNSDGCWSYVGKAFLNQVCISII